MRCFYYVGAAVAVAPGSLAFHLSPCPANHGSAAVADSIRWRAAAPPSTAAAAVGSSRRRAGAVAAPGTSVGGWRWTGDGCVGCLLWRRPGFLLAAASSDGDDGLGRGTERHGGGPAAPRPTSSPRLQNIPPTSLVLRDEATGCDIYLVGCLHGSHASGRDVQDVLEEVRPGAVVLELCESRHKALRQDLEKKAKGDAPLEGRERWISVFRSWGKGVRNTSKKAGVLQGLLAGLLSAPYLVQRLGDFDPGLEFKTAMAYADASKLASRPSTATAAAAAAAAAAVGPWECAVVLGDRDVQETLRRLGGALTALTRRRRRGEEDAQNENGGRVDGNGGGGGGGSVMGAAATGDASAVSDSYWSALASDLRILQMAVVGPSGGEWPDSLNVFDTVWRERQALGALILPLLFILTVISEAVMRSIGGAASVVTGGSRVGSDGAPAGVGRLGVFGVIKERDDVLAENVLKACRAHPGRPVVAVLGLLHCNGVADILRNSDGFRGAVVAAGGE
eukprot:g13994.t1